MKRILALLLSLCMILMLLSSAIIAFADEGEPIGEDPAPYEEYTDGDDEAIAENETADYEEDETYDDADLVGDDADAVEEHYADNTTVYDLENEEDVPAEPDEEPPPEDPDAGDDDSEIYDDESYDDENALQLQGDYVLDEIIIKFKDPSQVPGKEKQLQKEIEKVQKIGFVEDLGVYVVKADGLRRDPNSILNRYKNNKYVEYVEPNYVFTTGFAPNDQYYTSQSLVLMLLNAQDGWDILKGSSTPIIAVVDSGVASHPDLPPLLDGYSAVAGLSPNNDTDGHGTGVAGTIGCIGNNKIGVAGINWSASILPVKVDDAKGTISTSNLAKGIIWAADNGAKVINISCGSASDSTTIKNAVDYAYSKGCAIIAGAGNDGKEALLYPARYSNVIAVGATSNGSTRISWSSYGSGMNVVAYGSYYTATPSGGYNILSGTSFATPQVSALASMVWALNPDLTVDELYNMIQDGCRTLGGGYNTETGYGMIDIGKTLKLALDSAGNSAAEAEAAAKAAAEAEAKAKAEAEAKAKAEAEAAAEAEAKAKAEAEAAAAAKAKAEAEAAAAAEAEAKAKAEAEAAAAAEAEAKAKAEAEAAAKAKAEAEAKAQAEAEARAKAEAEAAAAAEAEAKAKAEAEAKAAEEAAAQAESSQETWSPPTIKLVGFNEMTLEYGQGYIESGYTAFDCKNGDLKNDVRITNTVDIWKAGLYTVTYEVADSAGLTARATRTVTVNPKPADPTPPTAPKITIIGSNPIILHLTSGTPYKEQSAKAVDGDGTDISDLVKISGTVTRDVADTYTITYTIVSPVSGLSATATRDVRIVAPTEKKDPRTKYGLSGQAKQGALVIHTGIVSNGLGFMDLKVSSIDNNMTIIAQLINTSTNKAAVTDTFSAAGTKQYKIEEGKYQLVVAISKANGNSKYSIDLLMPEVESTLYFDEDEVPLYGMPQIAPIGSNPIILHVGGTPYFEQGARATDFLGNEIPKEQIFISGDVNEEEAGTYIITYTVMSLLGIPVQVTRDVRIIAPNEYGVFEEEEVPLDELPDEVPPPAPVSPAPPSPTIVTYIVVKGDSLYGIAQKLLGNGNRWGEIYEMNKAVIGNDPRMIMIGAELKIKIN